MHHCFNLLVTWFAQVVVVTLGLHFGLFKRLLAFIDIIREFICFLPEQEDSRYMLAKRRSFVA